MTRKKKVAELERNVERVFLEFSIVVLIVVLLTMMIEAREGIVQHAHAETAAPTSSAPN